MATVICDMLDCKHRSRRKLKTWRNRNGAPCYGCSLDAVVVGRVFDLDGDIEAVSGKENMAICKNYEPA